MTNFNRLIYLDDVYFISELVKDFDKDFRLCFDPLSQTYMVVNKRTKEIVLTQKDYPSGEILYKLQYTSRSHFDKIFSQIEENNLKISLQIEQNTDLKSKCQLNEVCSYLTKNPSKDLTRNQIKNIIGEL